jgi:predicted nucleic acid-binding protein
MTAFLDTNVLISLLDESAKFHEWCVEAVERKRAEGPALISDIVFCEFSAGMPSLESTLAAIGDLDLERIRASDVALFRAGAALKDYRTGAGTKSNVLSDFLIGAEAAVYGVPLITANPKDFVNYFPEMELISPVP